MANLNHQWLRAGDEIFPALLAAIDAARETICLEIYIVTHGSLAQRFHDALVRARGRGVRVRVLVDAVGSLQLGADHWQALRQAGGEIRWFNPLALRRFLIRDHRKLLVCDARTAFVGGFNIAPEYEGDGIGHGWCDLGLKLEGEVAALLEASFDQMFAHANFRHRHFTRLRKSGAKKVLVGSHEQILCSGPGRGTSPFQRALNKDLAQARRVQIMMAYFLPPWRLRRDLLRVVRRGGRVQLLLGGKSDVPLSQLAAQSFYRRLLKGNLEIWEYQPQILHAKLIIIDDIVYAGSSNLDPRSLHINYELMIRFQNKGMADEARDLFAGCLSHARAVTAEEWNGSRTFLDRLKQRWAHFILSRIDPYIAHRQWRSLPKWRAATRS
jgi:cardiolipin synthase